jgi:hypothetical protein
MRPTLKLSTRFLAVVAAPAMLAGLMLAGAAGSSPTVLGGSKVATVNFTAQVILGTNTFTIDSTSCTIKGTLVGGGSESCFLSGSGTFTGKNKLDTANIAITDASGPISLSLSGLKNECATGTGVAVVGPPAPVVATIAGPLVPSKSGVVSGTIVINNTGTKLVGCEESK